MPQYSADVIHEVLDLLDAGQTQGEVSRQTKIPQPTISRWVRDRRINPPVELTSNGHLPAIPPVHAIAPEYTSALPVHQSAPDLGDIETRLQVVESFIATLQAAQRESAPTSAPEYTSVPTVHYSVPAVRDWRKTGATIAADMLDAIDTYAARHRLEKREVLDLALRSFFAVVAVEVPADA